MLTQPLRSSTGPDVQKVKDFLQSFLDCFDMPTKEFCKKYGLSKETEQSLEHLERKAAEKEMLLNCFSQN